MKKFFILLCVAAVFSVAGYSQTYRYDVNGDGVVTLKLMVFTVNCSPAESMARQFSFLLPDTIRIPGTKPVLMVTIGRARLVVPPTLLTSWMLMPTAGAGETRTGVMDIRCDL